MRLIDADALPRLTQIYEFNGKRMEIEIVNAKSIDTAPTIDAVTVVRCKDCKRRKNANENGRVYWDGYEYYCEISRYGVTDDGFCSYGERKDDE